MDHKKLGSLSCASKHHDGADHSNFSIGKVTASALFSILVFSGAAAVTGCATDELAGLTTRDASTTDETAIAVRLAKTEAARQAAAGTETSENLNRQLASSMSSTDGRLEQSFTKLMNTPQAADYLNQEVGRLLAIDALSDVYLSDFDSRLNKAVAAKAGGANPQAEGKFLENEAYAQLLAARRLQIEAEKRLSYFLYRALETKWSEDVRPEYKQGAVQLVDHFKYTLQRRREDFASPEIQKLTDRFMKSETAARAVYQEQTSTAPAPAVAMELNPLLLEIKAKVSASYNGEKNRKTAAAKNARAEIEILRKEIQESWATHATTSEASAGVLKIEPNAGPNGTLSGEYFPKDSWALTYEGGPSSNDEAILSMLEKSGRKATFFWKAENLLDQKKIIEKAHGLGMTLATQSFSGFDLSPEEATVEKIQHEIVDAIVLGTKAYGERPQLFRCPFASCSAVESVRDTLETQKMVQVLWNVDGIMWKDQKAESIYGRIHKQMLVSNHGIITMQDGIYDGSFDAALDAEPNGGSKRKSKVANVTELLLKDFSASSTMRIITVQENIDQMNHAIARTGQ